MCVYVCARVCSPMCVQACVCECGSQRLLAVVFIAVDLISLDKGCH